MGARSSANPARPPADFEPAYLALQRSGELARRAARAIAALACCNHCPRRCGANRLGGETGECATGRHARVVSYGPHHGEEDVLRGRAPAEGGSGSGTIFFLQCNLHCVFCQNFDISHGAGGRALPPEGFAEVLLELQALGCHNLNFVTPSHVVPQILEALPLAIEHGLRLPLVYNTSAYDAIETLRLLDGVVDVYMPDLKLWDPELARRYLDAEDYPAVARAALREMHRQVGVLQVDEHGLARRGVLVRHLVMPGGVAGTRDAMAFLAHELSPDTYVNLMPQYHPAGEVSPHTCGEIARRITPEEFAEALDAARECGLHRFDEARAGPCGR
jgi:putative pyruvate formate lyase activating enzyme